jgi:hypothetical protein
MWARLQSPYIALAAATSPSWALAQISRRSAIADESAVPHTSAHQNIPSSRIGPLPIVRPARLTFPIIPVPFPALLRVRNTLSTVQLPQFKSILHSVLSVIIPSEPLLDSFQL